MREHPVLGADTCGDELQPMTLDQVLHETMTIHLRNRLQDSIFEGRYELEESVGAGRMSSVYRARDTASGGFPVAVKLLDTQHPDRIKSELFRRETAALKLLRHQNVVSLLHSGWSDAAECFTWSFPTCRTHWTVT